MNQILSDEEITSCAEELGLIGPRSRVGTLHSVVGPFSRAIESAILAKVGAQKPVAWRHSNTHCLYETEEEVQLADADEWAEPLYTTPQMVALGELPPASWAHYSKLIGDVEAETGCGHSGWDCIPPEQLVRAVLQCARASASAAGGEVDSIRALGWSVAVHNDYRQNDEEHTFWLFTRGGHAVKGEGRTDAEALAQVRAQLLAIHSTHVPVTPSPTTAAGEGEAKQTCTYPGCNCPFDHPGTPGWCARGLLATTSPKFTDDDHAALWRAFDASPKRALDMAINGLRRLSAAPSPSAQAVPEGVRFFSYDPEGDFEEHGSADEAKAAATEQLDVYRKEAERDNEWQEEAERVCWGVIVEKAQGLLISEPPDLESWDFVLAATQPPQDTSAEGGKA